MPQFKALVIAFVFCTFTTELNAKTLLLASMKHPVVEGVLEPLIKDVYKELGYNVEFIYMSHERANISISQGLIDGGVVKSESLPNRYDNILLIGNSLVTAKQMLVCRKRMLCNKSVLDDSNASVAISKEALKANDFKISAEILEQVNINNLITLLELERVDYIVYPVDDSRLSRLVLSKFNSALLTEEKGFHALNVKFAELGKQVAPILNAKLE